jgi:hypothetical protein
MDFKESAKTSVVKTAKKPKAKKWARTKLTTSLTVRSTKALPIKQVMS